MQKTELAENDLVTICKTLYRLAQKHISASSLGDVNELVQVAKVMASHSIEAPVPAKLRAHIDDYSPSVVKQSAEYRLLRARFAAALGTIADMGSKKIRKNKSEFHAGINEGLRRASKIAIMFLEDLDSNIYSAHKYDESAPAHETSAPKPRRNFVR